MFMETLHDSAADWLAEATTEKATGLVRNVVLLGAVSRNGYCYAAAAVGRAAPLYEGRPIFLDHAEHVPVRRKLRDFAGHVVTARLEGDKLRGDLKLVGPNAGWLLELMEAAPRDIGMSHVVVGRRSADGQTVEHIERVVSVDVVAFPATTTSFRESAALPDLAVLRAWLNRQRVPPFLQGDALALLLQGTDPGRVLNQLGAWQDAWHEPPRSAAKPEGDFALSQQVRQSLIAAVRGR